MAVQPLHSALAYLNATPTKKWAAMLCSLAAAIVLVGLAPFLFLFVDLLARQGTMPEYDSLPAATRQHFHTEWVKTLAHDAEMAEKAAAFGEAAPNALNEASWRSRYEAARYVALARLVSPAAADHARGLEVAASGQVSTGILATVATHRSDWCAPVLGRFARVSSWLWSNEGYLMGLFLATGLLIVVSGALVNLAAWLATSVAIDAASRLRRAICSHSLRLSTLAVHEEARNEAADVLTRRAEILQNTFVIRMTTCVWAPALAVLAMTGLLLIHLWLGLAMLFLGGATWLIVGQWAAWFRRDARTAIRRGEARLAVLRENMTLMRLIKAYLMERFNQTRVERHLRELARAARQRFHGELLIRPTVYTVAALIGLILAFVAARVVVAGGISVAALIVQAALLLALAVAVHEWLAAHLQIALAREAAAAVFEFLDRRAAAQPIDAEFLQPLSRKLELVDVSYREPGTGHMILDGLSLSVTPGQRIAIVCSTPAEAHALAYLLTRFIDPTGGEIRMDGKNTRWVTYESLRTQVSMVMQDGLTFSDTVANNIGCGDGSFSLPQIIEAAKLSHAHQFVQRLPYGYETQLGGGGHSLRPGEHFRVALARAVLRDPSVLIIEEPAEPYDADSVALIDDALIRYQPGRTLIILARRSSTVKTADRVFVIQAGKLVAVGSHDHAAPEVAKPQRHA